MRTPDSPSPRSKAENAGPLRSGERRPPAKISGRPFAQFQLRQLFLLALLAGPVAGAEPYLLNQAELAALSAVAPSALRSPIATVIDKAQPSPSGEARDYVSYARYYWPDPAHPNGVPFVRRDGQHNREQVEKGDRERLGDFFATVEKLAAAWQVNRDEAAARRAGEWLRAWFVSPATRLNPHLKFAQVRIGHNQNLGTAAGVLDGRGFARVIDALRLLEDSPAFAPGEEKEIRAWFGAYFEWLTTAKNARAERAAKNNHGTWYLAQAIPIARYLAHDNLARELCESAKERIGYQIQPDGSQPSEISRADGLSYSAFNIEAHVQVARLAAGLGLDLWNYTAPNGGSLRGAIEFLRLYNDRPESWPTAQNARLQRGFLDQTLLQGQAVWGESK